MSFLNSLACLLNQHQPMRRNVSWDGRTYVGVCRYCESPIQRLGRRRWRKRKGAEADHGEPSST